MQLYVFVCVVGVYRRRRGTHFACTRVSVSSLQVSTTAYWFTVECECSSGSLAVGVVATRIRTVWIVAELFVFFNGWCVGVCVIRGML